MYATRYHCKEKRFLLTTYKLISNDNKQEQKNVDEQFCKA